MKVVVDKCKAFLYNKHSLTIYRDLAMIHRFETTLDIPDSLTPRDILKKLVLPQEAEPYAACFLVAFKVTKGSGQASTTPKEHPEIAYEEVTLAGLVCLNEFDVESYITLTARQSRLLSHFVGLEEEVEVACWEHLERKGGITCN